MFAKLDKANQRLVAFVQRLVGAERVPWTRKSRSKDFKRYLVEGPDLQGLCLKRAKDPPREIDL